MRGDIGGSLDDPIADDEKLVGSVANFIPNPRKREKKNRSHELFLFLVIPLPLKIKLIFYGEHIHRICLLYTCT